jgi:hypothetical protein
MKRRFGKLLVIFAVVILAVLPVTGVFAGTTATVTITATPEYLAITNDSGNWTIGTIAEATTVYFTADGLIMAEPLVNGDMKGTLTNAGSIASNIKIKCADFTSAGVSWNIREADNVPGADEVAIRAGITGMANRAAMIQVKNADSELVHNLAASGTIMWGAELLTGTFTDGVAKSGTLTLTIEKHT